MVRVTYIGAVPGPGGAAGEWQPNETRQVTAADALRLALAFPGLFRAERDERVGPGRVPPLQVR